MFVDFDKLNKWAMSEIGKQKFEKRNLMKMEACASHMYQHIRFRIINQRPEYMKTKNRIIIIANK